MVIHRARSKQSLALVALAAALLITPGANAAPDPTYTHTTTRFDPPMMFGVALDGIIAEGDPLIGLEVVEVRVFWDVSVADGYDAADIQAGVVLPIDTTADVPPTINLDGLALGWSGSGVFHHAKTTQRLNGFFAPAGTWFGYDSLGLPYDEVDILPTSRIEIDYLAFEAMGDANGDGFVDDADLAVLLGNWEQDPLIIATWGLGNFTEGSLGDTNIDDDDLSILLANWTGAPPAGASVPEPATLALLALGGLAVLRRRSAQVRWRRRCFDGAQHK